MTGSEMHEIRRRLRMNRPEFAALIGYTGLPRNNADRVKKMENGQQQVPLYIARLVWLTALWSRRNSELPPFPDWPGYEFAHDPDPQHRLPEED